MTDDLLLENEELLLAEYRRTLAATMAKLACRTMPPTLANLKSMMMKKALYGMISSFTILPMLLVDKSKDDGLNEMIDKDGNLSNNPGYSGELFKKAMIRRLPKFYELGLLD